MRKNTVKEKLARGETSFGTMVFEFASPGMAQIMAVSGAEFAIYDMEHSGFGIDVIKAQMAFARGTGLVPIVRPPADDYQFIARALDCGAFGLMMPMVETREQAERIVAATRYPPHGVRGAAFSIAHDDFEAGPVHAKLAEANERVLVITLIETAKGIENVEEIVAVPGIDVAWIGHFDLTNSMGIPGQFEHPDFLRALDRVLEACRKHGKATGFMAGSAEMGRDWMRRGFNGMIAVSGDIWLFSSALSQGIAALKAKD